MAGSVVTWAGNPLDLAPSLALRNHSPTGFAWGYGDSDPARLVRAMGANIIGLREMQRCVMSDDPD